jgi:hypothetical protein
MIARRRWHRGVFIAAGAYNIAWGLYTLCDPQWLFRFAGMPPANYPAIFACLAMVIGTNDFIWWIPFLLTLHDAWPRFRIGS